MPTSSAGTCSDSTDRATRVAIRAGSVPRRVFLGSVIGSLAWAASACTAHVGQPRVMVISWQRLLRAQLPLNDGAMARLSRLAAGRASSPQTLADAIDRLPECAGLLWVDAGAESSLEEDKVLERVGEVLAGEYDLGRVVVVDRWVLSETELVLLTLAHLAGSER
jgi:hypothetical protein